VTNLEEKGPTTLTKQLSQLYVPIFRPPLSNAPVEVATPEVPSTGDHPPQIPTQIDTPPTPLGTNIEVPLLMARNQIPQQNQTLIDKDLEKPLPSVPHQPVEEKSLPSPQVEQNHTPLTQTPTPVTTPTQPEKSKQETSQNSSNSWFSSLWKFVGYGSSSAVTTEPSEEVVEVEVLATKMYFLNQALVLRMGSEYYAKVDANTKEVLGVYYYEKAQKVIVSNNSFTVCFQNNKIEYYKTKSSSDTEKLKRLFTQAKVPLQNKK